MMELTQDEKTVLVMAIGSPGNWQHLDACDRLEERGLMRDAGDHSELTSLGAHEVERLLVDRKVVESQELSDCWCLKAGTLCGYHDGYQDGLYAAQQLVEDRLAVRDTRLWMNVLASSAREWQIADD